MKQQKNSKSSQRIVIKYFKGDDIMKIIEKEYPTGEYANCGDMMMSTY